MAQTNAQVLEQLYVIRDQILDAMEAGNGEFVVRYEIRGREKEVYASIKAFREIQDEIDRLEETVDAATGGRATNYATFRRN